jgi:hypothetical protein
MRSTLRRLAAGLAAATFSLFAAGSALAVAPPGTVTVDTEGCTFTIHIDLEQAYPLVGWKVKVYDAANWNEGLTLFKGSGPTDANGDMTVGPFSAPEGHYNVAVDDEYPPDGSSIVVDFFLSCPAATPTASAAPTATASPSGEVLPAEGTPPPGGGGENLPAGGGAGVTPPPTDTAIGSASSDAPMRGWATFAAIAAITTLVLTVSRLQVARIRARTENRRSRG